MNTMTLSETTAIEVAVTCAGGYELRSIPLSKLQPSKRRNVRRGGGVSIPGLAASIERVRLLQNLVVVPAADGEHFDVVAGRRRLRALRLLAKRRKLDRDVGVPCLIVAAADARTASLSENVQREPMHPADEFEAFAALVAEGRPIEDIAADFGVSPLVVQRRLKLANVSPRLLADYRAGQCVSLERLMALAITNDHGAQEAAFYDAPEWKRGPEALRAHLTRDEVSASTDALARFVGLAAYEAAGGAVRRDLFSDEQQSAYLTDLDLLDRLARDRLAEVAGQVSEEGWSWVEVVPRATSAELQLFRRAWHQLRQPNKAQAKRISRLEAEQQALHGRLYGSEADLSDEDEQALHEQLESVAERFEAIDRSLTVYVPEVLAQAGAIVAIDHAGDVVVHRGLLRREQAEAVRNREERAGGDAGEGSDADASKSSTSTISDRLVRRLSAHRTAALQAEVARHPQIALVALVHRLARRLICGGYEGSHISLSATSQVDGLVKYAPDLADAPAAVGLRQVRAAWAERLSGDSEAMFAQLLAMPQADLMSLLAVCVASMVGAVCAFENEVRAASLAQAVGLDMHDWWTPTAAGYFEHVSKAKALEAVGVFAPEYVGRLAKLKKGDLAAEAERLAVGTGWLPAMLCAVSADDPVADTSVQDDGGRRGSGADSLDDE